jgi:hypothetical protein
MNNVLSILFCLTLTYLAVAMRDIRHYVLYIFAALIIYFVITSIW